MAKRGKGRNYRKKIIPTLPKPKVTNPTNPNPTVNLQQNIAPTKVEITAPIENELSSLNDTPVVKSHKIEFKEFFRRIEWFTIILIICCLLGLIGVYLFVGFTLFLTIFVGLAFAGILSVINALFNQTRFHYKFLLLNESVSRFLSVLASFLLGRIITTSGKESIEVSNIFWIYFLASGIIFCISVLLTNKLKNNFSDERKHECIEKTTIYISEVPMDEGFNQKVCDNIYDEAWFRLRKELDLTTNHNLQLFLGFLLGTCVLLIAINIAGTPVVPPP